MDGLNCGHQRGKQVRPFAKFRLDLAHYIIQVKRYSGRQGIKFTKVQPAMSSTMNLPQPKSIQLHPYWDQFVLRFPSCTYTARNGLFLQRIGTAVEALEVPISQFS